MTDNTRIPTVNEDTINGDDSLHMSEKTLPKQASSAAPEIEIGLSACLAGHQVRYNGGHSQSKLCLKTLSEHFTFKTFCPEVAAGFGTPRPTMRLVGDPNKPTLTYTKDDNTDLTQQLVDGFENKMPEFSGLDGYILMKNSPSCGLARVKVYKENGYPHEQKTQGIFAAALQRQNPLMPIEEEGRIHDLALRENFILRVYAYHNFRVEVLQAPTLHKLINFHRSYKYVLMAHNQKRYKELGRMLANIKKQDIASALHDYLTLFMHALSKPANAKNHSNTLLHILGYLKKTVPSPARQHIAQIIHKYREGELPLVTPLVLLKHYIQQNGSDYIRTQRYLQPYPENLGLSNRIL